MCNKIVTCVTKLISFVYVNTFTLTQQMTSIGVPSQSSVAAVNFQKNTLEMLLNLQKLVDEFKVKLVEMDEEMQTIKIENNLLKTKIKEITSTTTRHGSTGPVRRGLFGYGADEF